MLARSARKSTLMGLDIDAILVPTTTFAISASKRIFIMSKIMHLTISKAGTSGRIMILDHYCKLLLIPILPGTNLEPKIQ